jgi:L-2-hydroxyglutarate oxidase LhgO
MATWNIKVFEKFNRIGNKSSDEWNNAGTGNTTLCK